MIKSEEIRDILKKFEVGIISYIQNYNSDNPVSANPVSANSVQKNDFSSFRFRFGNSNFTFAKSPNTSDGRVMIDNLPDEIIQSILEVDCSGIEFADHFSKFYPKVYFENTSQVSTTPQKVVSEQFLDDPESVFVAIKNGVQKKPNPYAVAMVDNKDTLEMIMNKIKEMMPLLVDADNVEDNFQNVFPVRRSRH